MRFQVIDNTNPNTAGRYHVKDIKLDRIICACWTRADAELVAQALELQEVKTLEQLKLPLSEPNINRYDKTKGENRK